MIIIDPLRIIFMSIEKLTIALKNATTEIWINYKIIKCKNALFSHKI